MSSLQENLAQWAKLEPDQCRNDDGFPAFRLQDAFWTIAEEPTETDLALLLNCLLLAVARQGLRVRWYVDLRDPEDPHWIPVSIAAIDEAAHALLAAYVIWLEKNFREATSEAT